MRFIHTADLHLGKRLHEVSLIETQRHILGEILRLACENGCDAVVVAGDIYDKSAPSAEAVALFDWFATGLSRKKIALIASYGNHDSGERVGYGAELMKNSGVYLSPRFDGQVAQVTLSDGYGPVVFHLLPFLKPVTVSAACEISTVDYDDALGYVLEHCTRIDETVRNVLLCHQYVVGGERSPSEDVPVGGIDAVSVGLFDAFDYCALGHLHKPQRILRETVRYSGSPLKYSTDEWDCPKSCTLVELSEKGKVSVELLPLVPLHDVRRLVGRYEELTLRENYIDTKTDDFLHIILTDEDDIPDALLKLRTIYPNILRFEYARTQGETAEGEWSSGAAVELTPMELFAELYRMQNDGPLDEAGADAAARIFDLCGNGGDR